MSAPGRPAPRRAAIGSSIVFGGKRTATAAGLDAEVVLFDARGVNKWNAHQLSRIAGPSKGQLVVNGLDPASLSRFRKSMGVVATGWDFVGTSPRLVVTRIHATTDNNAYALDTLKVVVLDIICAAFKTPDKVTDISRIIREYAAYGDVDITIHPLVTSLNQSTVPVVVHNSGDLVGMQWIGGQIDGVPEGLCPSVLGGTGSTTGSSIVL